jgi:hypothetical protein
MTTVLDEPISVDIDALLAAARSLSVGFADGHEVIVDNGDGDKRLEDLRARLDRDPDKAIDAALTASAAGPDVIIEPNPAAAAPPSLSLLATATDVTRLLEAVYGPDKWLNGIVFEPEGGQVKLDTEFPYWWNCPEAGGFLAVEVAPTSSGTQVPGASKNGIKPIPAKPGNVKVRPFVAGTADPCISTFGMFGRDGEGRARRLLEANLPLIVENELWTGARGTLAFGAYNPFLAQSGATVLNGGTAIGFLSALAELEQGLNDRSNEDGTIHASSAVVTMWIAEHAIVPSPSGRQLKTLLGTNVIVGTGYPSTGPAGAANAAATRTNKWAYATGPVMYARNAARFQWQEPNLGGPAFNTPDGQRTDIRNAQDRKVRAECDFAVFWDNKVDVAQRIDMVNRTS